MKSVGVALTVLALLLTVTAAAPADVGFESVSRRAGSPGDRVDLTIGCGFCYPPCVGEPGHRHPPGARDGICMLGGQGRPPTSFQVWLTPLRHSLERYTCDPAEDCALGARPPRLPSFVYLGRAAPLRAPEELAGRRNLDFPRYGLTFGVPEVRPGRYKYVLFCQTCVDGPRGSLIDGATTVPGRLRVAAPTATASGGGGGAGSWVAGAAVAALLGLAGAVLRRGRTPRARPGRAA